MYDITLELINGIKLGIEHMDDPDGDGWLIALDLFFLRIGFWKESK